MCLLHINIVNLYGYMLNVNTSVKYEAICTGIGAICIGNGTFCHSVVYLWSYYNVISQ